MKRRIVTGLLAMLLAAGSAAMTQEQPAPERQTRAEAEARGPQVHVAEESLDFGTVKEGEDVKATFVIENRGQAELRILRAKPS